METQVQFALPKLREEILKEVTENEIYPYWESRMEHRLNNLELGWLLKETLPLIVFEVDDMKVLTEHGKSLKREKELVLFGIGNVVSQTWQEESGRPFALYADSKERWVLVSPCDDMDMWEAIKLTCKSCIERINRYVKVNVSVGLGSAIGSFRKLNRMYLDTTDLLEQKAVYGCNLLLLDQQFGLDAENSEMSMQDPEQVMDLVRYGSEDDIREAMGQFNELVRSWGLTAIRDIQQKLFSWLLEIFRKHPR
jgi:two-component system response regulator YesN